MHIEVLVEDASGKALLDIILPKLIGIQGEKHTWRLHSYKGVGRIPHGLSTTTDPAKRILLDQLPKLLRGYGRTPGIDAVLVVLDADKRDCAAFLCELKSIASGCTPSPKTMFRLAIEEIEAWYLGDREALFEAYPSAKRKILDTYEQDSLCDTWELLADAIFPGGSAAIKALGWPLPGQVKHDWAKKIGPQMDPRRNISPSFTKLSEGLQTFLQT